MAVVTYISITSLETKIHAPHMYDIAIVDIREDNQRPAHIRGSHKYRFPFGSFYQYVYDLVRQTRYKNIVVFYDTISEVNAFSCAQQYAALLDHNNNIDVAVLSGGFDAVEKADKLVCHCSGGC